MSLTASYGFKQLYQRNYPLFLLSTFISTIIGSAGGLIWEQFGDLNGRNSETAESLRRGNVGLVKAASTLTTISTCLGYWNNNFTALVSFVGSFLFWEQFLNIPYPAENGSPQGGLVRTLVAYFLQFFGVVGLELYSAFVTHTISPIQAATIIVGQVLSILSLPVINNSFVWHLINSVSCFLTYKYLDSLVDLPPTPHLRWEYLLGGFLGGFLLVMTNPILRNQFRFNINNRLWQSIYGNLMNTSFPSPGAPEFVKNASKIGLVPYADTHHLVGPINVLAAQEVPLNQRPSGVWRKTNTGFWIISVFDKIWPQSNVRVETKFKPRIDLKRPIEFYVPEVIVKYSTETVFKVPKTLNRWHENNQGLAWMALYGHLNVFLQELPEKMRVGNLQECTHYIDLQWMTKYKAKKDFYPYGGIAYFKFPSDDIFTLRLKYITKVDSDELISIDSHPLPTQNPDPLDLAIRNFASSAGFIMVAGFHLAGIHMFYNLVSLSLYNVFDVIPRGRELPRHPHPFRAAMNLHFYVHVLVEEKTTAHLLDRGGIFNQIFALEYQDLLLSVGDLFSQMEYGYDADLKRRAEVFGKHVPPNSHLDWQLQYKRIFDEYAHQLVNAIWLDDKALENDIQMQQFYVDLDTSLKKRNNNHGSGLPDRYYQFKILNGVANWVSDTLFVTLIMHEVYGTSNPTYATDPNLVSSAIPRDKPVPTLEDFTSVMLVTAATSRVRFPLILKQDPYVAFSKCHEQFSQTLPTIFWNLQRNLRLLETEWTKDAEQRFINKEYNRVLPHDIEIAAGY